MRQFLVRTSHSPRPLPSGRWSMTQRWNDLLFAHWPVPAAAVAPLIPAELEVETFQGSAWVGASPFWMDRIKLRGLPALPGVRSFPGLNLRTYVRDPHSGATGVFLLSVEVGDLAAVLLGRALYRLPYHWAEMHLEPRRDREFSFYSRRRLSGQPVLFKARYRGLGPTRKLAEMRSGTLEHFLMERSCMFLRDHAGRSIRTNLRHVSWPLEEAEADIERNDLAAALGIALPDAAPVLYYARRLAIYIWPAELVRAPLPPRTVTVAVTPS
jgi:uncharacterized protein YqjF (DUF2071 family)